MTASDRVMRTVAEEMGVGDTFRLAPVGVFFGRNGRTEPGVTVPDPYFGGAGPERTGCTECGACMTGCREGAKNTLEKNYLYLAERAGVRIEPLTTVTAADRPASGAAGRCSTERTGAWRPARTQRTFTADQVVLAAGAWGTQQLLHRMKATGVLPRLSDRLGELTRTNSEALAVRRLRCGTGVTRTTRAGVAITSSFFPEPHTHVEPVRYAAGSQPHGVAVDRRHARRWSGAALAELARAAGAPPGAAAVAPAGHPALVGAHDHRPGHAVDDNSLTLAPAPHRLLRGLHVTSHQGHGEPNPNWIPSGYEAMSRAARLVRGFPGSSVGEIVDVPMTAHLLGGCVMGTRRPRASSTRTTGCSATRACTWWTGRRVSANLGVNPSLTITAQAERAMAAWPRKGEADPRPALGEPYRRVAPVSS